MINAQPTRNCCTLQETQFFLTLIKDSSFMTLRKALKRLPSVLRFFKQNTDRSELFRSAINSE